MTGLLLPLLLLIQGPAPAALAGTVTGTITRADGTPAAGVRVTATDDVGANPAVVAIADTDAAGRYALRELAPGRYRVIAGPLQVPTYYPGVTEEQKATAITVTRENGVGGVDIRLFPDDIRARALLASTDIADIAWGGWLAGESGAKELADLVEKQLASLLGRDGRRAESAAIATLTDALIRLDAKPSVALLDRLSRVNPSTALVLLSRMGPEGNSVLFSLLNRQWSPPIEPYVVWTTAANLLLAHRAPGFAARMLSNLPLVLDARLVVCSPPPTVTCPKAQRLVSGAVADAVGPRPLPNFPGWPLYALSFSGNNLLAPGPTNVFYNRYVSETGPYSGGAFVPGTWLPPVADRLRYIAAAAPGVTIGIQYREERRIETNDSDVVKREEQAFKKDILERFSAILVQLKAAGVLTEAEATEVARTDVLISVVR